MVKITSERINVSAKILADISLGIYRSPANAIKELVSNAFDADAHAVRISTDTPDFSTFTCSDDGVGITADEFVAIMQRIGGSGKRVSAQATPSGRPIIGKIGIGILAVAQICDRLQVIASKAGSPTKFLANVSFIEFRDHDAYRKSLSDEKVEIGRYELHRDLREERDAHYTRILLEDIENGFQRRLRVTETPEAKVPWFDPVAKKPMPFRSFVEWVLEERRKVQDLPAYHKMLWELASICPIPYFPDGPIVGSGVIPRIRKQLRDFDFHLFVDGIELFKPLIFPLHQWIETDENGQPIEGEFVVFPLTFNGVEGEKQLNLEGYLYHQSTVIYPPEVRGVLIRVRNVGIGSYDRTLFSFPGAMSYITGNVSGEIYLREGLEDALNIDRNSFRETDPHFLRVQDVVFKKLVEIAQSAHERSSGRTTRRRDRQEADQTRSLENLLSESLNRVFKVVRRKQWNERPIVVDHSRGIVTFYIRHQVYPRKTMDRWIYERLILSYEIATFDTPGKAELDRRFYDLLARE